MAINLSLPSVDALPADASTRVRILTAGVEVLHTEGFAALTQQAVAVKAGVRQSHITYYFPTRLDLLQATAQFGAEAMMSQISNAALAGKISFEQFRDLLMPDETDRNWWRLMIALVSACAESESIRGWIVEFERQVQARLREGFSAFHIALTDLDAEFLHATYIGALTLDMQAMTEASQLRAREIVGRAIDALVAAHVRRGVSQDAPKTTKAALQRTVPSPPRPDPGNRKRKGQ
jgi:AcrR family transcriptional regulator